MILNQENILDMLRVSAPNAEKTSILNLVEKLFIGDKVSSSSLAQIKTFDVDLRANGELGCCCAECNQPLVWCKNTNGSLYFRHKYMIKFRQGDFSKFPWLSRNDIALDCSLYSNEKEGEDKSSIYKDCNESERHKEGIQFIVDALANMNDKYAICNIRVNKRIYHHTKKNGNNQFTYRIPDVYLEIMGQPVVIELQRAWIEPETIQERELFYFEMGIGLIWVCLYDKEESKQYSDLELEVNVEGTGGTTKAMISYGSYMSRWKTNPVLFYLDEYCTNSLRFDVAVGCWNINEQRQTGETVKDRVFFNQIDFRNIDKSPLGQVCPIYLLSNQLAKNGFIQRDFDLLSIISSLSSPTMRTNARLIQLKKLSEQLEDARTKKLVNDLILMIRAEWQKLPRR